MGSITAASILDQARIRHPLFAEATMPDGALVLFLNQRQRSLLLEYGDALGPLVTTSTSIATTISGLLVGSSGGVPVYLTTYQDGWPVFSSGGVPYFDFTGPKIAGDPFGANGGTPGFPLPDNFVRLLNISVTYNSGVTGPVDVLQEKARHEHALGRNPACFLNGNRLVPVLPTATSSTGSRAEWEDVDSVELSYIATQTIDALSDTLTIPDALAECLVADTAALLAMRSKGLSVGERQMFAGEALRCAKALGRGVDMIGDVSYGGIIYTGEG